MQRAIDLGEREMQRAIDLGERDAFPSPQSPVSILSFGLGGRIWTENVASKLPSVYQKSDHRLHRTKRFRHQHYDSETDPHQSTVSLLLINYRRSSSIDGFFLSFNNSGNQQIHRRYFKNLTPNTIFINRRMMVVSTETRIPSSICPLLPSSFHDCLNFKELVIDGSLWLCD
ncbi:hypothetical protein LXL04_008283 [Taraxacum kok-saghyz]